MPEPELTAEEQAALLQLEQAGADGALPGGLPETLPVVEGATPQLPPDAAIAPEPEAPPDPNDPHNQYMAAEPEPEPEPAAPPPEAPAAAPSAPPPAAPPATPTKPPTESRVVSTKPDWYESLAPPESSPIPGVVGGLGLGVLGALLARKSPAVAAGMAGLGGLTAFQSLAGQPQREYDNRLSAAERQAAMHAKLTGGAGGDSELGHIRAQQAQERLDMEKAKRAEAARVATAMNKLGTPETIAMQKAVIELGYPEEQAMQMTGAQLDEWRTGFQQKLGQERGAVIAKGAADTRFQRGLTMAGVAATEHDRREENAQQNLVEKEEREVERGKKRAQIGGWDYIGEGDPSNADTNAARNMAGQVGRAVRSARELKELSKKVKISAQAGGLVYQAFGDDKEQKRIINRMKVLQNMLGAAQREIFHQGVPQQFEMAINSKTNPEADSLRAVIEGSISWEQLEEVMRDEGVAQMFNYNYAMPEGSDLGQSGVDVKEPPRNFQKELAEGAGETTQMIDRAKGVASQVVDNVTGTAKQIAGPATQKMVSIRIKDDQGNWSTVQQVTEAKFNALKQKLKDNVRLQ
jgi:hypothetical protein